MIKQQVNLYQPVLFVQRQYLTLPRLAWSWLLLAASVAVMVFMLQQQHKQLSTTLSGQQAQRDTQAQEASMYQQALAQRQPAPALQKQYQVLQHSVMQKQQLLSYLAGQQQQAGLFYSPVLQHLQTIDRNELWLTAFSLQQQYSSFSGIALQPDAVPLWLEDLRKSAYFRGQRFSQISLEQVPAKEAVGFSLMAQPGERP